MVDDRQLPDYFEFASRVLDDDFTYESGSRCVASVTQGKIRAVVIYSFMTKHACCMSVASDGSKRWLSRSFLRAVFAVPFAQWGMSRVTALVRPTNEAALGFDRNLGFKCEGRMRAAFGDEDAIIFGMTREECRFLESRYGQERA